MEEPRERRVATSGSVSPSRLRRLHRAGELAGVSGPAGTSHLGQVGALGPRVGPPSRPGDSPQGPPLAWLPRTEPSPQHPTPDPAALGAKGRQSPPCGYPGRGAFLSTEGRGRTGRGPCRVPCGEWTIVPMEARMDPAHLESSSREQRLHSRAVSTSWALVGTEGLWLLRCTKPGDCGALDPRASL